MPSTWVGIDSRSPFVRILATRGCGEMLLKARLAPPMQPRALPILLQALSLWHNHPVNVALAVGDKAPVFDMAPLRVDYADLHDLHYAIELVPRRPGRQRCRDEHDGLGRFRDLRWLLRRFRGER